MRRLCLRIEPLFESKRIDSTMVWAQGAIFVYCDADFDMRYLFSLDADRPETTPERAMKFQRVNLVRHVAD